MAEDSGLQGLHRRLEELLGHCSREADGEAFCADFRSLVEEHASRWQVPLPQLRILEIALCYFARASTFFTTNCDHVHHTLSSLALSVFELLLFFDQKDFHQEPLKQFTVTFQECHCVLARHQNVHLLQVERVVQAGGPWASSVLQAILSESSLPQSEVDGCISSELPVFLELRVRYLLSCGQRVGEAMALAKCCAQHPTTGRHLFFLQVYLTWLSRTSQQERLHREVADFNGKEAVHIICSLECEESDELLLSLSRAFLSQQLRRGDMYNLCDLVFIWSKLHCRLKTSKEALLEESRQLMFSATNVNSIFPFIRAILQELGEDGVQFCVELCANALESCLPCDVLTKSLIYKTIAGLLPNDLEVCRACALLVFFLERSVEAYKIVYLLYMHPDQEYHVEFSPIRNHVRFETLQILKKGLYFDPEFWNLIALRTNCLKLMSEKVVSAALEEIMEDKWIHNYCTKETASACRRGRKGSLQAAAKRRHHKEETDSTSKKLKVGPGKPRLGVDQPVKKKGNQASRHLKDSSSGPLRRSFWQLDRLRDNGNGEHRRTTRLSEKNPPKRRIIKPRWLLEDSGTLDGNNPKNKKHRLKHPKHQQSPGGKKSENTQIKNTAKDKTSENSISTLKENKSQKGNNPDCPNQSSPAQVVLELSLPDNELMGSFMEETCNRHRGFPQVLLYKPTVKLPAAPQPVKPVHGKEVILRARDAAMFIQQLHCYTRRQKGKGNGTNIQGSVSTITRSSVQGSPPKDVQSENPPAEMKSRVPSLTTAAKVTESRVLEKVPQATGTRAVPQQTPSARELSEQSPAAELNQTPLLEKALQTQTLAPERQLCEESAVEMKVTIASQTPTATKTTQSPGSNEIRRALTAEDTSKTKPPATDHSHMVSTGEASDPVNMSDDPSLTQDALTHQTQELKSVLPHTDKKPVAQAEGDISDKDATDVSPKGLSPSANDTSRTESVSKHQVSLNDISALTLVTEMVTELPPGLECHDQPPPEGSTTTKTTAGSTARKSRASSRHSGPHLVPGGERTKEETRDVSPESSEYSDPAGTPECEESKLEFCCTFCNKVFKGSRVVAHAMFHYRKDECMFCGTMFKDDLLAMMHLSDHIEKLKRIRESSENHVQENCVSETKDISTPKTSAKAKTDTVSSGRRTSGRSKTSPVCPTSQSLPEPASSGSRKLRSNIKDPEDGPSPLKHKHNASKHFSSKTPAHRMNGHMGRKRDADRLRNNMKPPLDPAAPAQEEESQPEARLMETQPDGEAAVVKHAETQEMSSCPVAGCPWFTDLSKNRVALLYHALDDHHGDVSALQLAFRIGNSRCNICMRVLWSFEHFLHHVERHRVAPRHPCLHRGCTARFKTGNEMRRHARRHEPLQAVCCQPGCSQLFICLWALNLHEREHYACKSTKTTPEQTDEKHNKLTIKKPGRKPKGEAAASTVKTEGVKAARRSRGQDAHETSTGTHVKAPSSSIIRTSSSTLEFTGDSEVDNAHVPMNPSNKNTSAQPLSPNPRLRQRVKKVKLTNSSITDPKSHKVISSSLFKHNIRHRHKVKKQQVKVNTQGPKRRGRPPKKAKHDENATTAEEKTDQQKSPDPEAAETPVQDGGQSPETSGKDSNSKKSVNKQIRKNHVKQKGVSHKTPTAITTSDNSNKPNAASTDKTHKATADKLKRGRKARKRSAPTESGRETVSSDCGKAKKLKVMKNKTNTETPEKKDPESASNEPAESPGQAVKVTEISADEEEKEKVENTNSTLNDCNIVQTSPSTAPGEETLKVTEEQSKEPLTLEETTKENHVEAFTDSSRTNEKHKEIPDKGEKKQKCKDSTKTSASKRKTKAVPAEQCAEAKVEEKIKEETSDLTPDTSSIPAAMTTSGSHEATTAEDNTQKPTKKEKAKKTQDPSKPKKKRKDAQKDGEAKVVRKKSKNQEVKQPKKKKEKVQPVTEVKAEGVEGTAKTPQSTGNGTTGYSVILNGQAAGEELKSTVVQHTLEEYSKRPFMRLPPTAYLDEKYTTMPKRRKEVSFLQVSQRSPPPEQARTAAAVASGASGASAPPRQRQRCSNCFATFNSGEELQGHVRLQTCSNLFGFDSDDEGNS